MKKSSKQILVFLFISLFFVSLIAGVVSAQVSADRVALDSNGYPTSDSTSNSQTYEQRVKELDDYFPPFIANRIAIWELGAIGYQGLGGTTIKYLILALVILLVYSSLVYVNFPPTAVGSSGGGFVKFIISVIVGFLSTFLLTTSELITILQSYTSLGVTLSLFFPILILVFFSLVTAKVGNPMGIFAQKIIWVIYSGYLFFKSLFYLIILTEGRSIPKWASWLFDKGESSTILGIAKFFVGDKAAEAITSQTFNPIILTIMLIMAIAVFIIFVLGNKPVVAWMDKEARDSEIEAQKAMLERSHAYDKLRSEEVKKT